MLNLHLDEHTTKKSVLLSTRTGVFEQVLIRSTMSHAQMSAYDDARCSSAASLPNFTLRLVCRR